MRKLLKETKKEPQYLKRIPVKSPRGTTFVLTKEIDLIAAAGGIVSNYMLGAKHI